MSLCDFCGSEEDETFTCTRCGSECCIECGSTASMWCDECEEGEDA